ncbi:class I SAM-dependent methyltransferase [Conexibacter woesei]|uniref:Methyltransferase type 11 n=1 Tax=Conexibacter woesei (strain DSM 14684 / CCUG 47730 / CIP 108061 / JCM 11494 / NBRC 100937 / ID131577) TaxID=469383 RepID=D3EZ85_CONWI|nr:class I SAM-dependent methyltransferase [Conexibacter woesei]ADB51850.1 Methyltransferase type 11 [Conexibacter woesei DSM 14684]
MTPRDWNAASYHQVSTPHQDWGRAVLDRLELRGEETVLDLGCGTGRITRALLERLPAGRVVAVDGSAAMVERARAELAGAGTRATVIQSDLVALDLAAHPDVPRPADAAISTATFHWIADHDALFRRVHTALRPGGQFVAQCGGEGNVASVVAAVARLSEREPFAPYLGGWAGPWNYASAEATRARLEAAGFAVGDCWLQPWPVEVEDRHEFYATVVLGSHLERLPADLHDDFVAQVAADSELDYVRLNLVARRA